MKANKREWLALLSAILILILALSFLTVLLTPKQHDYGSTWGQYLAEEPETVDVLFLGSSLVYCDVVPGTLWEETGLTAMVMAGPEQTIPVTRYYLEEARKTQRPQAIFVEVTGLFYDRYTGFTKTNVGQMPWGGPRLAATFQEAEPELRKGLLFPLLFYHDRWHDLTREDWTITLRGYEPDLLAGYTPLDQFCQTNGTFIREFKPDRENLIRNLACLEEIRIQCLEAGAIPVFYVAPTLSRVEPTLLAPVLETLSQWDGVAVLNCNDYFPEIGAEFQGDFFDPLHYNTAGAVKFTAFLGRWIEAHLELKPQTHPGPIWQQRADYARELADRPMAPRTSEP